MKILYNIINNIIKKNYDLKYRKEINNNNIIVEIILNI